jgi:LacI family transcriptional regulator
MAGAFATGISLALAQHSAVFMANIYDVARSAGVSITTVSHVLNGTRRVRDETKDRVVRAIDQLGYQPSALARALVRQESRTIALIVPDNANPFYAELARGIENYGFAAGFNVFLCNSDQDPVKERAYLNMLISKRVDGVIYLTGATPREQLQLLLPHRIPIVTFGCDFNGIDAIIIDDLGGGRAATEHLLALGHRRIACIDGRELEADRSGRVEGYLTALRMAGIAPDPALIVTGDWGCASGWRATEDLMQLPVPPSAIFACNDLMAIGAMSCLHQMGIDVPKRISIIGFDDITLARFCSPPLTTVATPMLEAGQRTCEMLLDRISGHLGPERQQITVPVALNVRQSTAPRGQQCASQEATGGMP